MDFKTLVPKMDLFEGLSDQEIDQVLAICRMDQHGCGELIWREGDEALDLCLVSRGQVELRYEMPGRASSRQQTMVIATPGKAFGWSALVPPHQLTLSAYGGEDGCAFARINAQDLVELFENDYHIGYICYRNLARVIAKRFRAMEDELARSFGMDVMHNW